MITSRLVCGYATCFGQVACNGTFWTSRMFQDFLNGPIVALPLRVDHRVLAIERNGLVITNVGAARKLAVTTLPTNGLLCMCEVAAGRWGDALLRDVKHHQDQGWLPPYSFSLGCDVVPGESVLPYEVSLTTKPAFSDARVRGVGDEAMAIWQALTEAPALAEVSDRRLCNVARLDVQGLVEGPRLLSGARNPLPPQFLPWAAGSPAWPSLRVARGFRQGSVRPTHDHGRGRRPARTPRQEPPRGCRCGLEKELSQALSKIMRPLRPTGCVTPGQLGYR